jgi:hypothetical protein
MRTYLKLSMTALVASVALTALVSTASARSFSLSNQNFRVTWSSLEFVVEGVRILCPTTIEGSFHSRTIAKVVGSLIGYITRAIIRRPCVNGTMWFHSGEANEVLTGSFPSNLPWHIQYGGFVGALPNITSVRLVFPGLLLTTRSEFFGIPILCEYVTTNANGNAIGTANRVGGVLTILNMSGRIRSNTGGCPDGTFVSAAQEGVITLLGNTTGITVTLI